MDLLEFSEATHWQFWLSVQHDKQADALLRIGRRHSSVPLITIDEAGELALCFGWIDSQRKTCDEMSFLQRYSPRRPGAPWSKINVERAESLVKAGRMRAPGFKEIDETKVDGRWDAAYEAQRTANVPAELTAALAKSPLASAAFDRLSRSDRYLLILPLLKAYTPETRASALTRVVKRLATHL